MKLIVRWVTAGAFLGACTISPVGGDDNKPTNNGTGSESNWTLTVTPARPALTIQHGNSDTVTITATRGGGFTGAIAFYSDSTVGVPTTITNMVTTGTVTTALLTVGTTTFNDNIISFPLNVRASATSANVFGDAALTLNITRKNGFWTTAPAAMSVAAGAGSGPTRVTFTKTGFTSDVTASLPLFNGAPAGITATFTPNPIVGDTVTSMTILVDGAVPEGTYSVGVRMNGGGYQGTAPLSLTVTARATLTMSFVTNPLIVAKGSGNSTLINLVRTNFTAGITPTVTSTLPTGVTVSWGPSTSFGPTISMSVSASAAAVAGTYILSVTSGGVGVPIVTIPLTLTITP